MRSRARLFAAVLLFCAAGCAGGTPAPAATAAPDDRDEAGSSRASREAAAEEAPPPVVAVEGSASFSTTELGAIAEVEDGVGGTVAATAAIGVDLDSRLFPARALDPVLHAGSRAFHHYEYVAPGTLRFVVPDAEVLAGELYVQYGSDAHSRRDLVPVVSGGPSGTVAP